MVELTYKMTTTKKYICSTSVFFFKVTRIKLREKIISYKIVKINYKLMRKIKDLSSKYDIVNQSLFVLE